MNPRNIYLSKKKLHIPDIHKSQKTLHQLLKKQPHGHSFCKINREIRNVFFPFHLFCIPTNKRNKMGKEKQTKQKLQGILVWTFKMLRRSLIKRIPSVLLQQRRHYPSHSKQTICMKKGKFKQSGFNFLILIWKFFSVNIFPLSLLFRKSAFGKTERFFFVGGWGWIDPWWSIFGILWVVRLMYLLFLKL